MAVTGRDNRKRFGLGTLRKVFGLGPSEDEKRLAVSVEKIVELKPNSRFFFDENARARADARAVARDKKKLIEAGIETADDLLSAGSTVKGREVLAEKTGIKEKLILEWVNLADLFRIKGVAEFADLLVWVKVDSVAKLAKRFPHALWEDMYGYITCKHYRETPSGPQIQQWIEEAKKLNRNVKHARALLEMAIPVRFIIEDIGEAEGVLIRSMAPDIVDTVAEALPLKGRLISDSVSVWFNTSIRMTNAQGNYDLGDSANRRVGGAEPNDIAVSTNPLRERPFNMKNAIRVFTRYCKNPPGQPSCLPEDVILIGKIVKGLSNFSAEVGTEIRMKIIYTSPKQKA